MSSYHKSMHDCVIRDINPTYDNRVSDFVYFTRCNICLRLYYACKLCSNTLTSVGYVSEFKQHVSHLLTHYNIHIPAEFGNNFLQDNSKWGISKYHAIMKYPQLHLIHPIICMESLNELILEHITQEEKEMYDDVGPMFISGVDNSYNGFLLYLRYCSFECKLCNLTGMNFEYEVFPTLDIVVSHCISVHNARNTIFGMPTLAEFINLSAGGKWLRRLAI